MNTKRDMIRKAAAFVSALTFISATNMTSLSAMAAVSSSVNESSAVYYNRRNTAVVPAPKGAADDTTTTAVQASTTTVTTTVSSENNSAETTTTETEPVTAVSSTTTTSAATTTAPASTEPASDTTTTTTTAGAKANTSTTTTTTGAKTTTTTTTAPAPATTTTTAPFIRFDVSDAQLDDDRIKVLVSDIKGRISDCDAKKETEGSDKYIRITCKNQKTLEDLVKDLSELKLYYPADFEWKKGYDDEKEYSRDSFDEYSFDTENSSIEKAVYYKVSGANNHLTKFNDEKTDLISITYRVKNHDYDDWYIKENTKLDSESFILDDLHYAEVRGSDSYTVNSKIRIDDKGIFKYSQSITGDFYRDDIIYFKEKTFTLEFKTQNAEVEVSKDNVKKEKPYKLSWKDIGKYTIRLKPSEGFDSARIVGFEKLGSDSISVEELIKEKMGSNYTPNDNGANYDFEVLGEHSTLKATVKCDGSTTGENIPLIDSYYHIDPVKIINDTVYYLSKCEYAYNNDIENRCDKNDYTKIIGIMDAKKDISIASFIKEGNSPDSVGLRAIEDDEVYFVLEYTKAESSENSDFDALKVFNQCGQALKNRRIGNDPNGGQAYLSQWVGRIDITDLGENYKDCTLYCKYDESDHWIIEKIQEANGYSVSLSVPDEAKYIYFCFINTKAGDTYKTVPMKPFYVYFDEKAPTIGVIDKDTGWTNHKNFLLDIEELYGVGELDNNTPISERLNNIAKIIIDDLVFEKSPEEDWEEGTPYKPSEDVRSQKDGTPEYYEKYVNQKEALRKDIDSIKSTISNNKEDISKLGNQIVTIKADDDNEDKIETIAILNEKLQSYKIDLLALMSAADEEVTAEAVTSLMKQTESLISELNSADTTSNITVLQKIGAGLGTLNSELENLSTKQEEYDNFCKTAPFKDFLHSRNVNEPYSATITPVIEKDENGDDKVYFSVDIDVSGKEGQYINDDLSIIAWDHSGNPSEEISVCAAVESSPPVVQEIIPEVYEETCGNELKIKASVTDIYTGYNECSGVAAIEAFFCKDLTEIPTVEEAKAKNIPYNEKHFPYNEKHSDFDGEMTIDVSEGNCDYEEGFIALRVKDKAGNEAIYYYSASGANKVTSVSKDATPIKLDRTPPVITEPVYDESKCYKDDEGAIWFNTDQAELTYKITDNGSGIKSLDIDTELDVVSDSKKHFTEDEKKTEGEYKVTLDLKQDGKYTVDAKAEDNVNNTQPHHIIVCRDTVKPQIERMEFFDAYGNPLDSAISDQEDPESVKNYRIFANTDITVRIFVKDKFNFYDISSGIKKVHIILTDSDGKVYYEGDIIPREGNNYADYTIPEGFKGDVLAWVEDNAGNTSGNVRSYGIVSEPKGMHDKDDRIRIDLPEPDYKDENITLYSHDITAKINVSDPYSGINEINWEYNDDSVEAYFDEKDAEKIEKTVNYGERGEKQLTWKINDAGRGIVTDVSNSIDVNLDKNDIIISVDLDDNAGNGSSKQVKFSIDKTAPEITVSGIEESNDVKYYNTHKTANITVKDRNNKTTVVNVNGSSESFNSENSADIVWAKDFNTDGRYSLDITSTDLAGNRSQKNAGTFVIDTTAPRASINVRKASGSAVNIGEDAFVGSDVDVTVIVDEVNFDPNSINVTINGTAYSSSGWSDGNTHSLSIPNSYFSKDGKYVINVTGKDKAGNSLRAVSASFTVDKKKPDVHISGVSSANNGTVAPVITINEENLSSRNVEVYRNGKILVPSADNDGTVVRYNVNGNNYITGTWSTGNGSSKLSFDNFPSKDDYDGYYTIDVATKDRANNERKESLSFSVNRGGSVFTIENEEYINNRHLPAAPTIRITERNVDKHGKDDDVIIIVDKGTNTIRLSYDQYTVSEPVRLEDGSGYEYVYTIEPKVFDQDLDYNISIQTVDAAGNKNVSTLRGADVSFSIDTHEPEFRCDDLSDHAEFKKSEVEFRLNVNEKIQHIKVTTSLNEVLLDSEGRSDGENSYIFAIPASNTSRDLTVELIDLAGNRTVRTFSNLLVTENVVLYAMHKTWAKAAAAASVIGLGAIGGAVVTRRKKKRY